MSQQKGSTVELLLGVESAYKTIATVGYALPFNTFGVKGSQALNTAQTITGTRNPVAPFAGNRNVAGSIVVPVDSVAMWYWAYLMFGEPSTGSGPPYEHEFKIQNSEISVTLEAAFTDLATAKYLQFLGCKIANWSVELGGDGELVSNIDILGASDTLASSSFDSSPTSVSLARVNNFQAALTEGGGALSNARSVSFALNFGLDESNFVIGGSGVRGSLPEGIVGVSGNVKTLFENDTLLAKALGNTESGLKITITGSANSIFEVEFQELLYERNSPDIPGPQGLLVDLNFQGYYDDGSEASAAVVRITNTTQDPLP